MYVYVIISIATILIEILRLLTRWYSYIAKNILALSLTIKLLVTYKPKVILYVAMCCMKNLKYDGVITNSK